MESSFVVPKLLISALLNVSTRVKGFGQGIIINNSNRNKLLI